MQLPIHVRLRSASGDLRHRPQHGLERGEYLAEERALLAVELDAVVEEPLERLRRVLPEASGVRPEQAAPDHPQDLQTHLC